MKKLLILIILLSTILLSGCGIFNLNYFVIPDDIEFLTIVQKLDTPEKIGDYMQENFTYKANPYYAISPYILWKTGKGDCNDFACFGVFVANYHGYETYQIKIWLKNITCVKHYLAIYVEGNYSVTDNQYYHSNFNTFREIVDNCEWTRYEVYDYENNLIEAGDFN